MRHLLGRLGSRLRALDFRDASRSLLQAVICSMASCMGMLLKLQSQDGVSSKNTDTDTWRDFMSITIP